MDLISEHLVAQSLEVLNQIHSTFQTLIPNDNQTTEFINNRTEYLQQFSILAGCYHQINNIAFLGNTEELSHVFRDELVISTSKLQGYIGDAIENLQSQLRSMISYNNQLLDIENHIYEMLNLMQSEEDLNQANLFDTLVLSTTQDEVERFRELFQFLEDSVDNLLHPLNEILDKEINSGSKILQIIASSDKNTEQPAINREEIARMCEVLSMGMESNPTIDTIFSHFHEVSPEILSKQAYLKEILELFFG